MKFAPALAVLFFSAAPIMALAATPEEQLEDSLQKWQEIREGRGSSYTYEVKATYYSGSQRLTTITVEDGKVVKRELVSSWMPGVNRDPNDPSLKASTYVETGDDIGSHLAGEPAKTLDELYEDAEKILASRNAENAQPRPVLGGGIAIRGQRKLVLEFDDLGLLKTCYLTTPMIVHNRPKGCRVENLKLLGEPAGDAEGAEGEG